MEPNRRDFVKAAAVAAAAPAPPRMIGIQVGAVSFLDEGAEQVLDILEQRGAVNTLFLAVFTYGRGIAGRQVPGQPLPDHGKQEYDLDFHGGNYGTVHPQYYRDTGIRPEDTRAPDHGSLDIIAEVAPRARRRGLRVILWTEDVWRNDIPGIEKLQEVDLHGCRGGRLCIHNPSTAISSSASWRTTPAPTTSTASCGAPSGTERWATPWAPATAARAATPVASSASAKSDRRTAIGGSPQNHTACWE